jgi:hypothetical protein
MTNVNNGAPYGTATLIAAMAIGATIAILMDNTDANQTEKVILVCFWAMTICAFLYCKWIDKKQRTGDE